ncbi:MAG: molybdopterin molybdenumtransferase MoeA [Pseudonocardiaceae bacterium]|nr:molybdopterin molybdenumtransferase MoeA [Pseudonocardiaceae bacterium]
MTGGPNADPVHEAYAAWERCCRASSCRLQTGAERVGLIEAVGRVTAAPVRAIWSSPAHDLAAMDGIALRAADTAGASSATPVRLRAAAFHAVDTGDPLPPDRDAVVMREHVHERPDGTVELFAAVGPGRHVRTLGEDVEAGELLLPAGHRIRPVDAAVAAAAGHTELAVRARPVVAVLPTGDEVRPIGSQPGRGEVIDTNSLMLAEQARDAGCAPITLPIVPDDPAELAAAVRAAADGADLVLIIAGSSKGRDDHTVGVLADLGHVAVHGAAIRPGHPVALGVIANRADERAVPAIGVPGYPVSAAHVFTVFALPMLQAMQNSTDRPAGVVTARLMHAVSSRVGVEETVLVRLEGLSAQGEVRAVPAGRGAGALSALMRADGLLRIPAASTGWPAGSHVPVQRLAGAPGFGEAEQPAPPSTTRAHRTIDTTVVA